MTDALLLLVGRHLGDSIEDLDLTGACSFCRTLVPPDSMSVHGAMLWGCNQKVDGTDVHFPCALCVKVLPCFRCCFLLVIA